MHLELHEFCEIISGLQKSNSEKAVAVLWFHDFKEPNVTMTARELARILVDYHVGNPDPSFLAGAIKRDKLCNETKDGFVLKPGSRKIIRDWLPEELEGMQPAMDHAAGYLPEAIWIRTRGYIEAVCRQFNGCFKAGYYDAAQVMLRRLLETLIIEAYEHLGRQSEIKSNGGTGHYFILKELVEHACGEKGHAGLTLGRDAQKTLKEVREFGNWSAHARNFLACAADLTSGLTYNKNGVRLAVQELIQIANLQRP